MNKNPRSVEWGFLYFIPAAVESLGGGSSLRCCGGREYGCLKIALQFGQPLFGSHDTGLNHAGRILVAETRGISIREIGVNVNICLLAIRKVLLNIRPVGDPFENASETNHVGQ